MSNSKFYTEQVKKENVFDIMSEVFKTPEEDIYKDDELTILCEKIKCMADRWLSKDQNNLNYLPESFISSGTHTKSPFLSRVALFKIHLKHPENCQKVLKEASEANSNLVFGFKAYPDILQVDIELLLSETTVSLINQAVKKFIDLPALPKAIKQYFSSENFNPEAYGLRLKDTNEYLTQNIPLLLYKSIQRLLLLSNCIYLEMLLINKKPLKMEINPNFPKQLYNVTANFINAGTEFYENYSALKSKVSAVAFSFDRLINLPNFNFDKKLTTEDFSIRNLSIENLDDDIKDEVSESIIYDGPIDHTIFPPVSHDSRISRKDNSRILLYGKKDCFNDILPYVVEYSKSLQQLIIAMRNYINPPFYHYFHKLLLFCTSKEINASLKEVVFHTYNEMYHLLLVYCNTINLASNHFSEKMFNQKINLTEAENSKIVSIASDDSTKFQISVFMIHNLQSNWTSKYKYFRLQAGLQYCNNIFTLSEMIKSKPIIKFYAPFVEFKEEIKFNMSVNRIGKDIGLVFVLFGLIESYSKPEEIAISHSKLVDYRYFLLEGDLLLGLIPIEDIDKKLALSRSRNFCKFRTAKTFISIQIPRYNIGCIVNSKFSNGNTTLIDNNSPIIDNPNLNSISEALIDFVMKIYWKLQRQQFDLISLDDAKILWKSKKDIYSKNFQELIQQKNIKWLTPAIIYSGILLVCSDNEMDEFLTYAKLESTAEAVILLGHVFCKISVRKFAIKYIDSLPTAEFCEICPILVTSLVYELHNWSMLICILIQRSWLQPRIAHTIFWNAKFLSKEPIIGERYFTLLAILLTTLDTRIIESFFTQMSLLKSLREVAKTIRETTDVTKKHEILNHFVGLYNLGIKKPFNLPINYCFKVKNIDIKGCKVFSSASSPILLSFVNKKQCGSNIKVIFKFGDVLQRDMLTLDLFRMMNQMWIKEGMDLKMVTYDVMPTGPIEGFIEAIPDVTSLAGIHAMSGIAGSFNDQCILNWLKSSSSSEKDLNDAIRNFLLSCAGFCVATYILGICDRHNDNILLLRTGQLFHIDFNKYLGDAQTFLGVKRDRAPFALTPDMLCVINEYNDQNEEGFQYFVDTCCQAYQIIRRNAAMIINSVNMLLPLNSSTVESVNYICSTLKLELSEHEAFISFDKLIKKSLDTKFTRINFLMHSIAQLKNTMARSSENISQNFMFPFCSNNEIFTFDESNCIDKVSAIGCIKGTAENGKKTTFVQLLVIYNTSPASSIIIRTVPELLLLSDMLERCFKNSSNILRQLNNISIKDSGFIPKEYYTFILLTVNEYFTKIIPLNVKTSQIFITFMHRYSRDSNATNNTELKRSESLNITNMDLSIKPEVKLSFARKDDTLTILVTHAKNLQLLTLQPNTEIYIQIVTIPSGISKKSKKVMAAPTLSFMHLFELPYTATMNFDSKIEFILKRKSFSKLNKRLGFFIVFLKEINMTETSDDGTWYGLQIFSQFSG